MFHMLSCFNLKESTSIKEFQAAVDVLHDHLYGLDLLAASSAIGQRVKHPIMDTDVDRDYRYYFITSFRNRAQCDASVKYVQARSEPGLSIHDAVNGQIDDAVFVCWDDV